MSFVLHWLRYMTISYFSIIFYLLTYFYVVSVKGWWIFNLNALEYNNEFRTYIFQLHETKITKFDEICVKIRSQIKHSILLIDHFIISLRVIHVLVLFLNSTFILSAHNQTYKTVSFVDFYWQPTPTPNEENITKNGIKGYKNILINFFLGIYYTR